MKNVSAVQLGILAILLSLQYIPSGQTNEEKVVPLDDFMGCWKSTSKPAGVIVRYDAFKKGGYSQSNEFVMISIEPVEGGAAFRNLVRGTLDIWSDTKKYYMPTIYYEGVYDPVRGVIITDSTFYLVDKQLIFVHHRTTEKSSDRALRYLDKVTCDEIEKKRVRNQRVYTNLLDGPEKQSGD